MKTKLIIIVAFLAIQANAEDMQERPECVMQLNEIQKTEITTNGLDAIQKGANNGNARDINTLGAMYLTGLLVEKDEKKGFEYVKKAAELGRGNAMRALYSMYFCGLGAEVDNDKGVEWFEKYLAYLAGPPYINMETRDIRGKSSVEYISQAENLVRWYLTSGEEKHKRRALELIDELIEQSLSRVAVSAKIAKNAGYFSNSLKRKTPGEIVRDNLQEVIKWNKYTSDLIRLKKGLEDGGQYSSILSEIINSRK